MIIMRIEDHYSVYYKDHCIGSYYTYENGKKCYVTGTFSFIGLENEPIQKQYKKSIEETDSIPFIENKLVDKYKVKGKKQPIYKYGDYSFVRIASETGEKYIVYERSASKGELGYSDKDYSASHYEGPKTPEGMKEWASWYCFNKMDDGTYEAELDEAWWWGGGHNDGGTIHTAIPEEWFELPYDEFLEKVVTLSAASHYGFTSQELKDKPGLQEFFGYNLK